MQSDSINVSIDNVSGALTSEAFASEWRNNRCKIERIIYTPASDVIDGEAYEYGYGDSLDGYPKLDILGLTKDQYILFEGIIDTFNATEQSLNATLTSLFTNWSKAYPDRTFNQNEFTSVVDAITEEVYWGREKVV
jgi:hypothetical protein